MQQHAGTKGVSETSYEIARRKSGCCGFAQDANWCRGIPLKEDRTARAQTMLEAHEALIKTAPENLPKFKDVIQYLEEELHLSK